MALSAAAIGQPADRVFPIAAKRLSSTSSITLDTGPHDAPVDRPRSRPCPRRRPPITYLRPSTLASRQRITSCATFTTKISAAGPAPAQSRRESPHALGASCSSPTALSPLRRPRPPTIGDSIWPNPKPRNLLADTRLPAPRRHSQAGLGLKK
jgi:hypothetical protein